MTFSLIEDNRCLSHVGRRYRIPLFTQYLALKDIGHAFDGGRQVIQLANDYYLVAARKRDAVSLDLVRSEFANLEAIISLAARISDPDTIAASMDLAGAVGVFEQTRARLLLTPLITAATRSRDRAVLSKVLQHLRDPYSPYASGAIVEDPLLFVGRESLIGSVRDMLEGQHSGAVWMVGPRRIGKSSILWQLKRQAPANVLYVAINAAILAPDTRRDFLGFLVREIQRQLLEAGVDVAEPLAGTDRDPGVQIDSFFRSVAVMLGSRRLVLTIDEADALFSQPEPGLQSTLSHLRELVYRDKLSLIMAGVRPPSELERVSVASPLFGIARVAWVGPLERSAAVALITKPLQGLLSFDENVIERFLGLTGAQPYLLQHLCSAVVQRCQEDQSLSVSLRVVEKADLMHLSR